MEFRRATLEDVEGIVALIQRRMEWMDRMGLSQWNKTHYLERYPLGYFRENIGSFIVACRAGTVVGAMAAYTEDARWPRARRAYHLHHLATAPEEKGLGRQMIAYAEELARRDGMEALRLDSAADNPKLSAYYEALGYPAVGKCRDGLYFGLLREKELR